MAYVTHRFFNWIFILLTGIALSIGQIAAAQDAPQNTPDAATDTPAPTELTAEELAAQIAAETEATREAATDIISADAALETRLNGIFDQVDNLSDLRADVSNGVVTLSGEVANQSQAERAIALAEGSDGTIIVQDKINRTLEVGKNLRSVIEAGIADLWSLVRALPLIFVGFLIIAFFWWLGGLVSRREGFWNRVAPNSFLGELLAQTTRVALIIAGIIVAMNLIGASQLVTAILGGAGVLGIAVGFAIRDTLENYFASIMLSLRQPFRAGDYVLIDGKDGNVIRLTSRATILMTPDGNHLRIPNSTVFKSVILNYTTNPERRFEFDLGVDAADNPVSAMQTGLQALKDSHFVLDDPAPKALIMDVGDSNIVIRFRGWVNQTTADLSKARSLSIRVVMNALETGGYTLPEPIYRVKLDGLPAGLQLGASGGKTAPTKSDKPAKPIDKPSVPLDAEAMDVSPDRDLEAKLEEEQAKHGDQNLLTEDRPVE